MQNTPFGGETEWISKGHLEELRLWTRERGRESLFSNQFYQYSFTATHTGLN